MKKYTYLLFDADETLFDFKASESIAIKSLFEHYNLPYDEKLLALYHKANGALWREYEKGSLELNELESRRFVDFFKAAEIPYDPYEASEVYIDYLSKAGILLEGAEDVLKLLSKEYSLILITNGISRVQRGRLEVTGTKKYFTDIIVSAEIGPRKPQKEFFDYTLNKLGAQKEDCLVIGDSLKSDIKGGYESGIDTYYLHLREKDEDAEKIWTYEGSAFKELLDLLLDAD